MSGVAEVVAEAAEPQLEQKPPGAPFRGSRVYWPESQYPDSGSGYVDPEAWPRITQALLDRGYGEVAARRILGENFLRIAGQVWR